MQQTEILQTLRNHRKVLQTLYNVESMAVFGSVAQGKQRDDSDVDVLIRFRGTASSDQYFGVQFYLEDLLHRPVDLVTDKALRPELRPYIERDAIYV